jgi:hypothetical protein
LAERGLAVPGNAMTCSSPTWVLTTKGTSVIAHAVWRRRADMAFVEFLDGITTGHAAYPRRYGQDFWADLAERPHLRVSTHNCL